LHSTRLRGFESQPPQPLVLLIRDTVLVTMFPFFRANFSNLTFVRIYLPRIIPGGAFL
jgi:hypothetical protein